MTVRKHRRGAVVAMLALLMAVTATARADDDRKKLSAAHLKAAQERLATADDYTAVEYCLTIEDRAMAVSVLSELVFKAYYDQKDIAATTLVAQAGITLAMDFARTAEKDDPKRGRALRNSARIMAYNLGSFCWPGWAEKGITLGPNDLRTGYEAARLNLRLAEELKLGDIACSRGSWLLGAQELAAGNHDEAIRRFKLAAEFAGKDPKGATDVQLNLGYAALAALAAKPGDADARASFEAVKAKLRPMPEGAFFVQQLDTAAGVFCAKNRPAE